VYANIYENVDAWRVKSVSQQGEQAWQSLLQQTDVAKSLPSTALQQARPIIDYQKQLKSRDVRPLVEMLKMVNPVESVGGGHHQRGPGHYPSWH